MTGKQHLNPVSSLAGRSIVCGPDIWLHYHGLDTTARTMDISMFFNDPENHQDVIEKYGIEYVFVSGWERSDYYINESALEALYPIIFESEFGTCTIYRVDGGSPDEE